MAGRPRKPTSLLEISGAFKKDPQRGAARSLEIKPTGAIGPPPAHWEQPGSYPKGALAAIWNEFVAEALPGVLGNSDRKQLEIVCVLTFEARRTGSKNQFRAMAELRQHLAKLGMNPTDRSRVSNGGGGLAKDEEGKPKGKLAAFTQRHA